MCEEKTPEPKWLQYLKENDPKIYNAATMELAVTMEQRDALLEALSNLTEAMPPPTVTARIEVDEAMGAAISLCSRVRREIAATKEEVAENEFWQLSDMMLCPQCSNAYIQVNQAKTCDSDRVRIACACPGKQSLGPNAQVAINFWNEMP